MASNKQKARRDRLFEQHPYCHWCGIKVIHPREYLQLHSGRMRMKRSMNHKLMATLDHLDSKLDTTRGMFSGMWIPRTVLACHQCNALRNKLVLTALPKETLHKMAHEGKRAKEVIEYDDGKEYPPELSFTFGDPIQ